MGSAVESGDCAGWSGSEISHAATPNAVTVAPYWLRFEASVHFKMHCEADCIFALTLLPTRLLIGRLEVMRWRDATSAEREGRLSIGERCGGAKAGAVRPQSTQKKTQATMAKRAQDTGDASSLSDPNAATFTHLSLTWDVNFDSQQIAATAEYDVKVSTKGADLFLDTKSLAIQEIVVDGTIVANWTLEDGIEVSTSAFINFSSQLFPMQ